MCGRYAVTSAPEAIRALFRYAERPNFPPRFNIAPTQPIAIVRLASGERHFALVRWGLLPSWAKDPKRVGLLINARGESVNDKPAFRAAMRRRRCLIPADGFYEWRRVGKAKQPYYIRRKSREPFAFAGLWETWTGPNREELESAAIVTTQANRTLAPIHERMPVIVPEQAFDLWLDAAGTDSQAAAALIAPAPDDLLEAFPVSSAVNRTANDNPAQIEPVAEAALEKPAAKQPAQKRKRRSKPGDGQPSLF